MFARVEAVSRLRQGDRTPPPPLADCTPSPLPHPLVPAVSGGSSGDTFYFNDFGTLLVHSNWTEIDSALPLEAMRPYNWKNAYYECEVVRCMNVCIMNVKLLDV